MPNATEIEDLPPALRDWAMQEGRNNGRLWQEVDLSECVQEIMPDALDEERPVWTFGEVLLEPVLTVTQTDGAIETYFVGIIPPYITQSRSCYCWLLLLQYR